MKRFLPLFACLVLSAAAAEAQTLDSKALYQLLVKIARAPTQVSFSGRFTELDTANGVSRRFVAEVVHHPMERDRVTVVEPADFAARNRGRNLERQGYGLIVPVPGLRVMARDFRARLNDNLALLLANYDLSAEPGEMVAGRPTIRIEFQPRHPRREFKELWVDSATGIVLRVTIERPFKQESRRRFFTAIQFDPDSWTLPDDTTAGGSQDLPTPLAEPIGASRVGGWYGVIDPSVTEKLAEFAGKEPYTLLSPSFLPAGFSLEEAAEVRLAEQPAGALHLLYTDGLSSVSLFLEPEEPFWPNRLREFFLGTVISRRIEERGFTVIEGERAGTKFVLVSDIGAAELARMADSLEAVEH